MTNQKDVFEKLRAEQEIKRQAIMSKVQPVEDRPVCVCGVEMCRHHFTQEYWCPCCEITATNLTKQRSLSRDNKTAKTTQQREAQQALIIAQNDSHPIYGYVRRLTLYLMSELKLECGSIAFRNRQGNECRGKKQADHSIVYHFTYGFHGLDFWVEEGFQDLVSWDWLWSDHENLVGKKAAWALVLHEVGHALQATREPRRMGSMHTQIWGASVQRLQHDFPFEEVKAI